MASASTPSANEPAKDLILVHTVQLKPIIKAQISGRMVGISEAIASVHSEETRLKKCMMIMIIIVMFMNKSQHMPVLSGCQKLTSAMNLRPEK